jgi:hypothetical protein
MAKNRLNDFSTDADSNTDVSGVGIQGSNLPSNLDNAIRALMAQIAAWRDGTTLKDTANFNDPDDSSKTFRFDAGNIPTATARVIDIEDVYDLFADSTAPRLITAYTASGTHTFDTKTKKYMLFAVGSGGGSGAVDGQGAGTGGCSAGGNSGFVGKTVILTKGALTTGAVVIGAAGTAGAVPSGDGGDGGDVTWTDATVGTLTWQGGKGSAGVVATSGRSFGLPTANAASTGSLVGAYGLGGAGITNGNLTAGGLGGSSPLGTGGIPTAANGAAVAGVSGTGYGAGAAGAAVEGVATNAAGAAGTGGRLEIWEW